MTLRNSDKMKEKSFFFEEIFIGISKIFSYFISTNKLDKRDLARLAFVTSKR